MNSATAKADTLIEAMGWIRRFRGKTTVIKLGGSLLDDDAALHHLLLDVIFMESVGCKPVIVHGGGKAISRALQSQNITPQFVRGRRVTDAATLQVVRDVLGRQLNEQITETIERIGGRAMNLSPDTTPVLRGEKWIDPEASESEGDLGFVGHVTSVDRDVIESLAYTDQVPVIPSLCVDDAGQVYNVNADTAAMAVAEALGAEKLVFLSDVNGVRTDRDDPDSIVETMTPDQARTMIASGQISDGMIPKVEACLATLNRGVGKVHIIDGRQRHSLLLEIFTTRGVGTVLQNPDDRPS